jgi:hypothetical protein
MGAAVDLSEKIPGMTDAALDNLRANAERLGQAGSPSQRTAATALSPPIEAELLDPQGRQTRAHGGSLACRGL